MKTPREAPGTLMSYIIDKKPTLAAHYRRPCFYYDSARLAFGALLKALRFKEGEKVLLPSYIGWSSREGSGVFDPVREMNLPFLFYEMNEKLLINLDSLKRILNSEPIKLLVIIHYFGFADPGYEAAVSAARNKGILVLEDEAHSMLTDLVGGLTGRKGDYCTFSLHKLLPVDKGGVLVVNDSGDQALGNLQPESNAICPPWLFDLRGIADARVNNAGILGELLHSLSDEMEPLRPFIRIGEIPQTFPVIVKNVSRDGLYFMMNDAGFGAVSLYHTLVDCISARDYPGSHALSMRIFNLPVHQDLNGEKLRLLVNKLSESVKILHERQGHGFSSI